MVSVLVTRPEPSAKKTAERLRAAGHDPHILPLAIAEHDPAAARQALHSAPTAIVITSAETTRVLETLGAELKPFLNIPIFAVGAATAEAAAALGFQNVAAGAGTGQALADLVMKRGRSRVAYLAGSPRSFAFEDAFLGGAHRLSIYECYRMRDISYDANHIRAFFEETKPVAILLYSAETVRRFFSLPAINEAPALVCGMRFLCISKTVADAVPDPFHSMTSISPAPDEAGLFRLL